MNKSMNALTYGKSKIMQYLQVSNIRSNECNPSQLETILNQLILSRIESDNSPYKTDSAIDACFLESKLYVERLWRLCSTRFLHYDEKKRSEEIAALYARERSPEQDELVEQMTARERVRAVIWRHRDLLRAYAEGFKSPEAFDIDTSELSALAEDYLKMKCDSPELERLLVDAMVGAEVYMFGEALKQAPSKYSGLPPVFGLIMKECGEYSSAEGNLERLSKIRSRAWFRPTMSKSMEELLKKMRQAYDEIGGPATSLVRVREVLSQATNLGAVWGTTVFAILDKAIQRSPVWM
jgi:hypothetical protein